MTPSRAEPGARLPWSLWLTLALLAVLHLAVAGRYDAFRNELYFIVCGRHPDFGYVDQPPLVPLLAAATQAFGDSVWLLHLPAVLGVLALIPLCGDFARRLGGGPVAAGIAGLAAGISPLLAAHGNALTTAAFEPLCWTALAYLLARGLLERSDRALVGAGLVAGVALEAKYGIALWILALALGVLATGAREVLGRRALWLGGAIALLLALPSLVWQQLQGWPFLAVIGHGMGGGNFTGTPLRFMVGQILAVNLVLAPLWLAGVAAPFRLARLRPARCLAIAYVAAAALVIGLHGKGYYLAGAYPTLFAVGAVACERLGKWLRRAWLALAVAQSLLLAPVVLPLLDPPALARFLDATHLRPAPEEAAGVGAPLTQVFSDELGWRALEHQVAAAYNALSPQDQARVAIIARNYGEAAALDVYGAADGLPPALSGQNQYWLWGTHGHDGSVVLFVNGDAERWARACASSEEVGRIGAPYVMPYENDRPIILCRGLKLALDEAWPRFRRYQ